MAASTKQYEIIYGWWQTPVFEEEIYFRCSSKKILWRVASYFHQSHGGKLSLTSIYLFSILNFICSFSDLRALFSKRIFCIVNFRHSVSVFLIGAYNFTGIKRLFSFLLKISISCLSALLQLVCLLPNDRK